LGEIWTRVDWKFFGIGRERRGCIFAFQGLRPLYEFVKQKELFLDNLLSGIQAGEKQRLLDGNLRGLVPIRYRLDVKDLFAASFFFQIRDFNVHFIDQSLTSSRQVSKKIMYIKICLI
jgi:hypothetical protein